MFSSAQDAATAYWVKRTLEQDLTKLDVAAPRVLDEIIWFSVRGELPMPADGRLPAFDAMRQGIVESDDEED